MVVLMSLHWATAHDDDKPIYREFLPKYQRERCSKMLDISMDGLPGPCCQLGLCSAESIMRHMDRAPRGSIEIALGLLADLGRGNRTQSRPISGKPPPTHTPELRRGIWLDEEFWSKDVDVDDEQKQYEDEDEDEDEEDRGKCARLLADSVRYQDETCCKLGICSSEVFKLLIKSQRTTRHLITAWETLKEISKDLGRENKNHGRPTLKPSHDELRDLLIDYWPLY